MHLLAERFPAVVVGAAGAARDARISTVFWPGLGPGAPMRAGVAPNSAMPPLSYDPDFRVIDGDDVAIRDHVWMVQRLLRGAEHLRRDVSIGVEDRHPLVSRLCEGTG